MFRVLLIVLLSCVSTFAGTAHAVVGQGRGVWSGLWENDAFTTGHDDRHYTNGLRIAYVSGQDGAPAWMRGASRAFPFLLGEGHLRSSLACGQNLYTPTDIFTLVPDSTDRPYAGWLYVSLGALADRGTTLDTVELSLGIVGPHADGKQVQSWIHRQFGTPEPRGWDHQLADELALLYRRERRWHSTEIAFQAPLLGWLHTDLIPHAGMALGNVLVEGSLGSNLRLGNDLSFDHGPPGMRPTSSFSGLFLPTKKLGWYLFAGMDVRGVLHNLFLDGNTLLEGPSVEKHFLVLDLQTGLIATWGPYRAGFTLVRRSAEFKGQDGADTFGAISVGLGL